MDSSPRIRVSPALVVIMALTADTYAHVAIARQPETAEPVAAPETGENAVLGNGSESPCLTPEQARQQQKSLSAISVNVLTPPGDALPDDCFDKAFPHEQQEVFGGRRSRGFAEQNYCWSASGLSHRPLYFEDVALERYGQKRPLQPVFSAFKFYTTVPILPYKIGLDPPHVPIYVLGYQRPGNDVPPVREHLPLSLRGAALEAGAVTGFVFLFP